MSPSGSAGSAAVVAVADRNDMLQAQAESDRRVHARHPACELTWINKVRLKYGPTMSLLDLSAGGVQIEIDDHWLRPDSTVVVEIVGGAKVLAVPSRVVRCQVTGIGPSVRYRGALEFKRLLTLPAPAKTPTLTLKVRDANPLTAHARLVLALKSLDGSPYGDRIVDSHAAPGDRLATLGAGAMAATLAVLNTPASQRAGLPFARELSGLLNDVAQGVEQRESAHELTARLERRLRRAIPARAIRVADADVADRQGPEAIYFDAPATAGHRATKIVVEFAPDAAPQEWQFQLLKASGHLVGVINELAERRPPAAGAPATRVSLAEEVSAPAGWNKLVVRFVDGRLVKGYCHDFLPARGHFHVYPSPNAAAETRVLVPMVHLKAVFFVRDFAGNARYEENKTADRPGHGRKVAVTFLDNELLIGLTLNYRPDGAGFVVTPCDEKSNNLRIFVSNRGVRHVKFL